MRQAMLKRDEEWHRKRASGHKWCCACKTWHPESAFHKHRGNPDGLQSFCRNSKQRKRRTTLERFVSKTEVRESGCIEWTGAIGSGGYGSFFYEHRTESSNRVAWMLLRGEITDGLFVLHKCDNRKCVNPDHLFLGTNDDNMRDMASKGRSHKKPGEKNPAATLSDAEVIAIRGLLESHTNSHLAQRYNVSREVIYRIRRGQTWSHLRAMEVRDS